MTYGEIQRYLMSLSQVTPARGGRGMFVALVDGGRMPYLVENGPGNFRYDTLEEAKNAVARAVTSYPSREYHALVINLEKGAVVSTAGTPPKPITWTDK